MARIERRGHRRAQIHIAQSQHQITGVKHDTLHRVDTLKTVDAAYKFQIARTPRRVLAHALHIFLNRQLSSRIVPRQRQMHDAGGHAHRVYRR